MNIGIEALSVMYPENVIRSDKDLKLLQEAGIDPRQIHTVDALAGRSYASSPKSKAGPKSHSRWDELSKKYRSDPYLGLKQKHVLRDGESILTYACCAAQRALRAANLKPDDIDMMIVSSMFPEHVDTGDSSYLSEMLGFDGLAWSISSTCTSAWVALQLAADSIARGTHKKVMVIATCTYSRFLSNSLRLSKIAADGAAAFIVGGLKEGQGIVASKSVNSKATNGIFFNTIEVNEQGSWKRRLGHIKNPGIPTSFFFQKYFKETCLDLLEREKVSPEDLDFFVSFNATGWYSEFCLEQLKLPREKTHDIFPYRGFLSNVSVLAGLYEAQKRGLIKENDLILIYNHGFTSNCVSMLLRWGDVALG